MSPKTISKFDDLSLMKTVFFLPWVTAEVFGVEPVNSFGVTVL